MNKNKRGFTLAEVLITLAIIGVVASMTVPAMQNNINELQYKSKFKSDYASLDQALSAIRRENGGRMAGAYARHAVAYSTTLTEKLAEKMANTKICGQTNQGYDSPLGNCWHITWPSDQNIVKELDGSLLGDNEILAGLVLNNGAYLAIYEYSLGNCNVDKSTSGNQKVPQADVHNMCARALIDVNGPKGPNTWGKDIYGTYILDDRLIPWGGPGFDVNNAGIPPCSKSSSYAAGIGCASYVLTNRDYEP